MKKTSNFMAFFMLLSFLVIQSCDKNTTPDDGTPEACATLDIAYNDEVKAIINNSCAYSGCHDGATAGIGDFRTYAGMKSRLDNGTIKDRAVSKDVTDPLHMPPSYATGPTELSPTELDMVHCWILDGYPEN